MDPLRDAIGNLQQARESALHEVGMAQARLAQIEEALAKLQNEILVVDPAMLPRQQDFRGLGALAAAKRWLAEVGGERSTREIWDEIHARGVRTASKKPVPMLYATLNNSDDFKRTGDRWALTKRAKEESQ